MLRNYIKIAWRNLGKNKGYSALNIGGLAIGMAAALLILLWVQHELSFDMFHSKRDRLYMAGNQANINGTISTWFATPQPLGPALKNEFPEITRTSRHYDLGNSVLLTVDEKKLMPKGAIIDSTFLSMFSIDLLAGDRTSALRNPNDLVISASLANRLFGRTDVIGETVKLDTADLATITGIMADIPDNSRFRGIEYLIPWSYFEQIGYTDNYWGNNSVTNYVELAPKASIDAVNAKIRDITIRHSNGTQQTDVFLHALPDWWLRSTFENGHIAGGRIEMVSLFAVIAGFILLIACINFTNLSTARSEKRAREVGIRKMAGAYRQSLIGQFLSESILIAAISGLFAIAMVLMALPAFNTLVERQLAIDFTNGGFWLAMIGFILLTGILAGSYPAFFLSAFNPTTVLKGTFRKMHTAFNPRKVLVVVQFAIAIALIVGTIVIHRQIQHGQSRDQGYDQSQVVYLLEQGQIAKNSQLIKQALLNEGIAESVTRSLSPITEGWSSTWGIGWPGKQADDRTMFDRLFADEHPVRTFGLSLIEGRDFDPSQYQTDSSGVLLNETAVKAMGFERPVGQVIQDNGKDWHVVGVVKDFIMGSPFSPVAPLVIEGAGGFFNVLHIKLSPTLGTAEAIRRTADVFKRYNPDYPFEYTFVDQAYAEKFAETKRTGTLAGLFAFLTVFISCLGLFGLAAYMAENRTKEIGVRKVLGASVLSITRLLSREFILLVLIACLVAFPIAYWGMDKFLQTFDYRISMGWEVFALAGVGALLLALATVSSQAIKAAMANPVESLRDE
ncbi:ABC transporter permease [Parapedobacter lycopersici]|uniref:ABC transporter permease n=1 Tax=Parapedobacter lycopersici TaxID=1864939 RepID=UPI00214D2314|nr:ABC transporter permease [Parapedobacter lycopersici]